ncbi:hypothetical protein ESA94_20870 [Lacibacter luteus]|uniref:Uncharacterized protein n=1 Tax=Lacibacter luteus TaxID=2508719 RepID=A0A4Q1CD77_9BACT|nr:hypothetical protein [Lacibacter luteus]RXK57506.1 hypothetical protein ESA94_20870 [Lacibacter luteus]
MIFVETCAHRWRKKKRSYIRPVKLLNTKLLTTRNRNYLQIVLLFLVFFNSCKKDFKSNTIPEQKATFPTTEKDIQNVKIVTAISGLLKEVYKNKLAFYEVNAAIYSGYYEDERVHLKDLLFPEASELYQQQSFRKYGATVGEFKKSFFKELASDKYPALNFLSKYNVQNQSDMTTASPVDTAAEIFANSSGVSIYFPYSENFQVPLTTQYFSNINTDPWGYLATVIPADREANAAPGEQPMKNRRFVNGDYEWYIDYTPVTVDDNYAENNITHIVGFGASPTIINSDPPVIQNTNRVYTGWVRVINKQYDNFISFNSENGGAGEFKVCRISGYLQQANQQVTNFAGDIASVSIKRRDVRKGIWKRIYASWDPDWKNDNLEQILAVYEEDREDTKVFTGSLKTTVKIDNVNVEGNIGYNITVKSQDNIVRQLKYTRSSYFSDAKNSQGWGFELTDKSGGGKRFDTEFLSTGSWPAYDGNYSSGADWNFTFPYKTF